MAWSLRGNVHGRRRQLQLPVLPLAPWPLDVAFCRAGSVKAAGCSGSSPSRWVGAESERPNRHQPVILWMDLWPAPSMPPAISHPPAEVAALQLHVSLNDIEPPIWRRVLVEESITLGRLHEVLQIVMGWQDVHLHQFITGTCHEDRVFFTPPWDDGFGDEAFMARQRDETRVKARTLLRLVGDSVTYAYDLGDGWEHTLRLEKVVLVDPMEQWLPCCLEGRRACPPEDVGGPAATGIMPRCSRGAGISIPNASTAGR